VEVGERSRVGVDPVLLEALHRLENSLQLLRRPARAGSDSYVFSIEGLISYEQSPGTVLFIGYTRLMEDSARFDFRIVQPTADGLFVKMSYRFRT